jgi:hypothetical protein
LFEIDFRAIGALAIALNRKSRQGRRRYRLSRGFGLKHNTDAALKERRYKRRYA